MRNVWKKFWIKYKNRKDCHYPSYQLATNISNHDHPIQIQAKKPDDKYTVVYIGVCHSGQREESINLVLYKPPFDHASTKSIFIPKLTKRH